MCHATCCSTIHIMCRPQAGCPRRLLVATLASVASIGRVTQRPKAQLCLYNPLGRLSIVYPQSQVKFHPRYHQAPPQGPDETSKWNLIVICYKDLSNEITITEKKQRTHQCRTSPQVTAPTIGIISNPFGSLIGLHRLSHTLTPVPPTNGLLTKERSAPVND